MERIPTTQRTTVPSLIACLENSHEEMRVCMKLSPPGSLACISCSHVSRSWVSVNPSASKNSGDNKQARNEHAPTHARTRARDGRRRDQRPERKSAMTQKLVFDLLGRDESPGKGY